MQPNVRLTAPQWKVFLDETRFRVLVAGRRFGKTYLAVPELMRMAWGRWKDGSDREAWYVAPTYKQARRDLWRPLKRLARPAIKTINETTMTVELVSGGRISLHGADRYDSLRGAGLNGLIIDEYADIAPEAWTEAIRPMLSDRLGTALFIGTPKGFNHFHGLFVDAKAKPGWASWQFTTLQGGNVPADEIEDARKDLDEKTFRQEYEASFENYGGRVYYGFERSANLASLTYKPRQQLCWSLDFNINPMSSVICQVQDISSRDEVFTGRKRYAVDVLDEISLPNSNTPEACNEFAERVRKWTRGNTVSVHVYGDPAGNARDTTSHASASDWQVVRDFFSRNTDLRASFKVASAHGAVKDGVNAMNGLLCNSVGTRHLRIDPRCKALIRDLEQIIWKSDSAGNMTAQMDKSDSGLTHMSDALRYLVEQVAGIGQPGGPKSKFIG